MKVYQAIAEAAKAGDVALVAELIEQTPDLIRCATAEGWTPLHLAVHEGHGPVAELLLAQGADVDTPAHNDLRNTPMLRAVMAGQSAMVALLLAHGADVNLANAAGATPLHKAAIHGDSELVRLLLAHGARTDARNSGGQTPLIHALYHHHTETIALLEQETAHAKAHGIRPHG
ncbi:MAG TPA: ankyrin repeat domain-containing protein [Ktedonobacterales bacterium]|nr:ankyrin repeat domain-containing protein [Ktedonobacterales bacterium]